MNIKLRTYLVVILMVLSIFAAPRFARAQTCGIYPQTFTYTGTVQTYTVPAGVHSLRVDAWGAAGGTSGPAATAGKGARVQATLAVSPGQVFKVLVGGTGQSTGYHDTYLDMMPGGFNGGGGNTGWSFTSTGGGATDLRSSGGTLSDRLVVAGGGGGGHFNGEYGGDGGAPNGEDGQSGRAGIGSYWGGRGATTSTGFALGEGGKGDGGGGGGYWGGHGSNGAGWTGLSGGGGGGSSWVTPTGSSAITMTAGGNSGHGSLTITPGTLVTVPAPTITSFTPTSGPETSSVTLTGTGLGCVTAVDFNGTPAPGFSVSADGTRLTVSVPRWASTGGITVSAPSGTATTASAFTVTRIIPATITSLSPTSGAAGTSVTITGTNFTGTTGVTFNSTAATVYTVNSPTQITAVVPTGATTGNVVITNTGVSSIGVSFTVFPPPVITSLSPNSGAVGTSVIITGTNFTGATGVTFNGTAATSFTVNSATQITATVPAVGTGNVVVNTPGGNSPGVSFSVIGPYITSLSPGSGDIGRRISIYGGNFNSNCRVTVNNIAATILSHTATSFIIGLPTTGLVSGANQVVVRDNSNSLISNAVTFTVSPPSITDILPNNGPVGTAITIYGRNFATGSTVTIGGVSASITSLSFTQIEATVPGGLSTGTNSVIITNNGFTSNAVDFTVLATATVSLTDITKTFGDAAFNLAATSNSSGAITYSVVSGTGATVSASGEVTITGAGSLQIKATQAANGNYTSGEKAITLTIKKASATITLIAADLTQTFSGTGKTVGYSIDPVGVTGVSVTYSQGGNAVASPTAVGSYNVVASLTNNNYTATTTGTLVIAPSPLPTVTNLYPSLGPVGKNITITGTNFTGATGVTFNGTAATSFTVNSATEITATVPDGATSGNLVVTTGYGTSNGVSFRVTYPPTITSLSPGKGVSGTPVIITGTNFTGTLAVRFNGIGSIFTVNSATQITAIVPYNAFAGEVDVRTADGSSNGVHFDVDYPPVIQTLSIYTGLPGTTININGQYFNHGVSEVSFNGISATFTVNTGAQITATIPDGATSGNVVVTTADGISNGMAFTVSYPPTITSLSPGNGLPGGDFLTAGTAVTITGTNFNAIQSVRFNGLNAPYTVNSTTQITANVPHSATSGDVVVHKLEGHVASKSNGAYFKVDYPPVIGNLSVNAGVPGTIVVITGKNFIYGATEVSINGVIAYHTVNSGTQITAYVPHGAATTGNVVVSTTEGASNGVFFDVNYSPSITDLSPNGGLPGESVIITGKNFNFDVSEVSINGHVATYIVNSATQITATIPDGADTRGSVYIRTTEGTSNSMAFTVSYPPTITSLSPGSGLPNTRVTITGTNFNYISSVRFNGVPGYHTVNSSTEISVTVPVGATSGDVVVHKAELFLQSSSNGIPFTVLVTPTITFEDINKTFGDARFNLAATSNSSGAITYSVVSGSGATVSESGEVMIIGTSAVQIRATQAADGIYSAGQKTMVLRIAKGSATITLSAADLNQTYSGSGKTVGYTTSPADVMGVSVTYSKDGNAVASPTAAGTYSVLATLTNNYYNTTSATGTLVIEKAPVTVTLGNLRPTYTGSPLAATATTNQAGLTVNLTYDGAAQAPTNAGSYTVTGIINDDNYTGSASGTLVIGKAASITTVTVPAGPYTYTGSAHTRASVTVTGAGGLSLTPTAGYANNTNAGTATASYTFAGDANHTGSNDSENFTIGRKAASVTPAGNIKIYGAAEPGLTGTTSGFLSSDGITASYSRVGGETVADGPYTISATLSPAAVMGNYDVMYNTANFSIGKAALAIVNTGRSKVYGVTLINTDFAGSITGVVAGDNITVTRSSTGEGATATVGGYPITGTIVDPLNKISNYTVTNGEGALTVTPASINVSVTNQTRVYGAANATLTGIVNGLVASDDITVTYSTDATTSSDVKTGGYPITATLNDPAGRLGNYSVSNTPGVLNITKAAAAIAITPYNGVYDGSSHTASGKASGVGGTDLSSNISFGNTYINTPGGSTTWTFNGGTNYNDATGTSTVTITPQTANPVAESYYTGADFYWTKSATDKTASLMLAATISNNINYTGDIRTARVSFFYKNGTTLTPITGAQNLPVGLVNPGDLSTGSASAIVSYNLGSAPAATLTIAVRVTGNYNTLLGAEHDALITVAAPTPGGLIAGGGKLCQAASAGFVKGAGDKKSEIGFYVQYNKNLKTPQGNVELIIRSYNDRNGNVTFHPVTGEKILRTFKIKSTAISILAVTSPTAQFTSKGNISEIVNGVEQSVEGNITLQMKLLDAQATISSSLTPDGVAVTVYRAKGGIWYSNDWNGKETVLSNLCGRNPRDISVTGKSTNAAIPTATTTFGLEPSAATTIGEDQTTINQLAIKAFPNPTDAQFNVQLLSDNNKDKVQLRVMDIHGRTIEMQHNLNAGQLIQIGKAYRPGIYIVEMVQGKTRTQVKLLKAVY